MLYGFYDFNGDVDLARELGLREIPWTHGEWNDLGEVQVGGGKVKVEVNPMPAQFWRFTCTHDSEGVDYPSRTYVVTTGSGALTRYWPFAEEIANGMIEVSS